ncbi:Ubiquitin recognition factor in ER-associated degradation protein 1 [Bienertia sinuspersici]
MYVDVVDAKPSNAVCIIETDVEVDFALPLDYKEPEKPVPKAEEPPKFVPFSGRARRLSDKGESSEESSSVVDDCIKNCSII